MVNLFHFLEFLNEDYEDNPHLVFVVLHQLAQDFLGNNFLFDFQTEMFTLTLRLLGNLFLEKCFPGISSIVCPGIFQLEY
jgi:hypothetical protein